MNRPVYALIVEDSVADAELLVHELHQGGFRVSWQRVETAGALRAALYRQSWDIILCDFTLPGFSGAAALQLVKELGLEVPFIFVSGTIGEETAVAAMKAGAQDYVMKSNLARVAPAVEREIREAEVRRQQRASEEAMRISEQKYRHLFESLGDAAVLISEDGGKIIDANPQAELLLGRTRAEILGLHETDLYPAGKEKPVLSPVAAAYLSPTGCDTVIRSREGAEVPVHIRASRMELYGKPFFLALFRDITERKRAQRQLEQSLALLRASFEAMVDGILVVDNFGRVVSFNQRFLDLLGGSPFLVRTPGEAGSLAYLLEQVKQPPAFLDRLKELCAHPERESCDLLELKDGRVFECCSQPHRLGDEIVGRVWSYRDVTQRPKARWAGRRAGMARSGGAHQADHDSERAPVQAVVPPLAPPPLIAGTGAAGGA